MKLEKEGGHQVPRVRLRCRVTFPPLCGLSSLESLIVAWRPVSGIGPLRAAPC